MDSVVIYENEAYLLKDWIKRDLNNKYKNCNFKITLSIENNILKGVHVAIKVINIKDGIDKYISVSGLYSFKDYYEYILITVGDCLYKLFDNYIMKKD